MYRLLLRESGQSLRVQNLLRTGHEAVEQVYRCIMTAERQRNYFEPFEAYLKACNWLYYVRHPGKGNL